MHLFDPIALRGATLPNRIVVSPMCQYSANEGCATDWHLIHWGQMLLSGAGMFTIEATAVSAEGRITPGCLGLYDDATESALAATMPNTAVWVKLRTQKSLNSTGTTKNARSVTAATAAGWKAFWPISFTTTLIASPFRRARRFGGG